MSTPVQPPHQKVSDRLHPLFGGAGYIHLALAMVSMLVFMAIAIPWAIWRAGVAARQRDGPASTAGPTDAASETFATWLQGRFATWTGEEKSSTAVVEVLLPLAAVAFGLTAIGIVFQLTYSGVV